MPRDCPKCGEENAEGGYNNTIVIFLFNKKVMLKIEKKEVKTNAKLAMYTFL